MKEIVLVLFIFISLFNFVGCNSNQTNQELNQIQQEVSDIKQIKEDIREYRTKMEYAMQKYKETNDRKYLDEAQYYSDKLDELIYRAEKYFPKE